MSRSSGANDAVHHITAAVLSTAAVSGASLGLVFTLFDGTTAQCSIVFRSDGAILLTSGAYNGATLAAYSSGVMAQNVWFGFEVEVKIDGTAGSFTVRKNGNSVADFTATGLNTRNSANNYANKLQLGAGGSTINQVDDFFWQSGAATGNWLGELRCLTRMPLTDQSVQFTKSGSSFAWTIGSNWSSTGLAVGAAYYSPFTAPFSGSLASVVFNLAAAVTGHIKVAIFDNTGANGGPGAAVGTAVVVANPVINGNTATLSGISLVKGRSYFLALCGDVAISYVMAFTGSPPGVYDAGAYASFPATNPIVSNVPWQLFASYAINPTTRNADYVGEAQQDGLTTYVFDGTPGDQDFYGIAPASSLTSTPFSTVAVITRAYMEKSDIGTRAAALNVKSGATTVASPTLTLTNSWQWASRLDMVDPNTSAAWTAAAVDALQVGPTVMA